MNDYMASVTSNNPECYTVEICQAIILRAKGFDGFYIRLLNEYAPNNFWENKEDKRSSQILKPLLQGVTIRPKYHSLMYARAKEQYPDIFKITQMLFPYMNLLHNRNRGDNNRLSAKARTCLTLLHYMSLLQYFDDFPEILMYLIRDALRMTIPYERVLRERSMKYNILPHLHATVKPEMRRKMIQAGYDEYCEFIRNGIHIPEWAKSSTIFSHVSDTGNISEITYFDRARRHPDVSRNCKLPRTVLVFRRSILLVPHRLETAEKLFKLDHAGILKLLQRLRVEGLPVTVGYAMTKNIMTWIQDGQNLTLDMLKYIHRSGITKEDSELILSQIGFKRCVGPGLTVREMVENSGFNHRLYLKITSAMNHDYDGYLLPKSHIIPDNLDTIRIKSIGELMTAGKECKHCIGSYASMPGYYFRLDTVCCMVTLWPLQVRQCYDHKNTTTVKSRKFAAMLAKELGKIRSRYSPEEIHQAGLNVSNSWPRIASPSSTTLPTLDDLFCGLGLESIRFREIITARQKDAVNISMKQQIVYNEHLVIEEGVR